MPHLDHASWTPPHPAALEALRDPIWADPTRLYASARRARAALDGARARCAAAIAGRPEEVTFTSGGTEALVLAITGAARAAIAARRPRRIVVSPIEQRSVLDAVSAFDGFEIVTLEVDAFGAVDPARVDEAIGDGAALVCVQVGNGEIGTLQPLTSISAITRRTRSWLLADASHAAGWIPIDVRPLGVDLLTVSGNRCGGLPGTGFVWARAGVRLRPMLLGDDRERGLRAGMPNLPGLVGLGLALEARTGDLPQLGPRLRAVTSRLRDALPKVLDEVLVHGHPLDRLPHIVSFTVPMVEGDALLLGLDAAGYAVHSGSACSSSTSEPSHVLAAIGTLTHGAIRVSIGPETTETDIDGFLEALPKVVASARATLGRSR